ncbi:MAG: AI-2E family transporter [Neisseriales bacterium]|jgi:predicted PurR-regulated permease PerM|nr:MAG: AI-2E family transporter [Neisseriales bacterium]
MQQQIKLKPLLSLLLGTILLFAMMVIIGKVLIPFIIALILAYVLDPVVSKLENKFKVRRKFSALIFALLVLFLFIAIPAYLIPVLVSQFKVVIHNVPQIIAVINTNVVAKINTQFGTHISLDLDDLKQLVMANQTKITNNLDFVSHLAHNGIIVIEVIVYVILIPFALFYSIINWNNIVRFFDGLIPRSFTEPMHRLFHDVDRMLSAYLRGQMLVMVIMASYYAVGLNIVGLPSGTAIGIITGLLVFIPYLGVLSGLLFAITIGLSQFSGSGNLLAIFIVFAIGHVLEGGLVTPFMVGGRIGLNPVMIIMALMVFGKVFGIVGVLLALPLSTIAVVLLRHAKQYYQNTHYYKEIN